MAKTKNMITQERLNELDPEKRRYSHSLITYAQEEEFAHILPLAKHFAYIKHDKDVNEDGTEKEEHYHILLIFNQVKSLNWIRKNIPSTQNTLGQPIKDIGSAFEYLWHKNEDNKTKYDRAEVITDNQEYWNKYTKEEISGEDKNEEFIHDLFDVNYNPIQMARCYGKDFIRYFRQYTEFRNIHYKEYHNTYIKGEKEND